MKRAYLHQTQKLIYFVTLLLVSACSKQIRVTITNHGDLPVSKVEVLDLNELGFGNVSLTSYVRVQNDQGMDIPSQLTDTNADGTADQLLVQISLPAKSSVTYRLSRTENPPSEEPKIRTYCRFVPERMDDFAWENDKVAFRAYGPACQRLFEQGNPAGLISSGIDCWLKRVPYPIINKWYKKEESGGSYHQDDGEGLDNFHVGTSCGCGGTAIRHRGDFVCSANFSAWEIIANGPLRSIFRLTYEPVLIDGKPVVETKTFTIDVGDHFYRCDVELESELTIDTLAVGLTLHENKGQTDCSQDGWISYWEPAEDSEMGMGAWVNRQTMLGCEKVENAGKDLDHIWLYAALKNNQCTYYSGFGWKKAGQFGSDGSWKEYIREQLFKLENPLSVTVK
ncbi:MAG: DUF4861 family protein [Mangrovibacterium sp.]